MGILVFHDFLDGPWEEARGYVRDELESIYREVTGIVSSTGVFDGQFYSLQHVDGNAGTGLTIDFDNGNEHHITLTRNTTLSLKNPAAGAHYTIMIATGAGGYTVSWPATVRWPNDTPPIVTVAPGKLDIIFLSYSGVSGRYYGRFLGSQNYTN